MSPVPCSLLLEVFEPTSLNYDGPDPSVVAYEISTDPAHPHPWLLAPRQYAEQEIDPIACTASIGQIEIGVIDVPEVPGDQDTGWMTARVHDVFGRRCRLTRYINETIGWIVIADGPAGNPSMDQSYSAFRWTIRDTRELERKLNAFQFGGVSGIVPRGPIYGFGRYTDENGDNQMLLDPLLDDDTPVSGVMKIAYNRGWVGRVMFDTHYVPQVIEGAPTAEDIRIWKESLRLIDAWAAGWRAQGQDPYDMRSGNGNQGLDAMIAASTINLNQFNAAAGQLGVSFGPGTRWIETFRNALVSSIGNSNTQAPAPILDDLRLDLDSDAVDAVQTTEVATGFYGARNADVLWRVHGDTEWNLSRPVSPLTSREAFATSQEHKDGVGLTSVLLFDAETIPVGFPAADALVEVIIRYRGPASEAFPYYVEGLLGQVLTKLYTGIYSLPIYDDIDGALYDPADQENVAFSLLSPIQYDSTVFDSMEQQVTLRQVALVEDVREWSQKMLYAPSGWVPALDNVAIISPILRNRPISVSPLFSLTNANSVPTPAWGIASRTVSEVNYSYSRFFVPDTEDEFKTEPDGLAIRPIEITYRDDDSDLRYGRNPADYDASAFSAIGTPAGRTLPNVQETAAIMAKAARFDILDRYRGGVQSFSINVRRTDIPNVRVGTWVPWDLSWLPDRISGVRGSVADAAQIIAIRDDTCIWRTITLEESASLGSLGGTPGLVITLDVLETDDLDPGLVASLVVIDDFSIPLPSELTNLVAWFEAEDLALADGAAVAAWVNKTASGADASRSASNKPTFNADGFGSLPGVHFDGTQWLDFDPEALPWFNAAPGYTFLIIVKPSSLAFGQLFNFLVHAALSGRVAVQVSNPGVAIPGTINTLAQAPDGASPGPTNFFSREKHLYEIDEPILICGAIDLATAEGFSDMGGVQIGEIATLNGGPGTVAAFSATDSMGAAIGARGGDGNSPFAGDMALLILWNIAHTHAELQTLVEYYGKKYGIRVPKYLALDSFNRADGALGSTETGQVWQNAFGGGTDFAIDTNQARKDGLAFNLIDTGATDYEVGWRIAALTPPTNVIMGIRCEDGLNNMQLAVLGTHLYFRGFVGGGYPGPEQGTTTVPPLVAGDRIACRVVGDQFTALINNVPIVTITNTRYLTGTIVGIGVNGVSVFYDDFYVKAL